VSAAEQPKLDLSSEELQRFAKLFYHATGMTFGEAKRYYIERRLGDLIARAGVANLSAYLPKLAVPAEMERLVNAFTINETYFYREEHQLRALGRAMLPEIVARRRPGDLVRIWSMPCSSGEEPYSIAIWLLENWPMVDAWHVEIVGSDIDTAALRQAKAGHYGERALARLPAALRALFPARPARSLGPDRRLAGIRGVSPGQPDRCGEHGAARPVRCDFLPQPADLFRRAIAPDRGRPAVRCVESRRLPVPRPHRVDVADQ
jgi:hypothetical protein